MIDLKTRRVEFAGLTTNPDGRWMTQIARNLTDTGDGFLRGKQLLIMDRDTKFCREFQDTLASSGTEPLVLPPRSPNLNSYMERFFQSLKEEALSQMIFFREASLRAAVREFLAHYHAERNHQGLGNDLIEPGDEVGRTDGTVRCRKRLGGLLRYYHRDAA